MRMASSRERLRDRAETPRRAVNLLLAQDIVTRARALTTNLSATVEQLLETYVAQEQARRRAEDARLDEVVNLLNAFNARHGYLSDEFSNL